MNIFYIHDISSSGNSYMDKSLRELLMMTCLVQCRKKNDNFSKDKKNVIGIQVTIERW